MKRGESGLSGILAIDKPKGRTSHDVVNAVRRMTGERRVGHAGTLDPMATGVLLVCVGPATRLSTFLTGHDKAYVARIVFGVATDTDDAEGRVTTAYTKTAPGEGLVALAKVDPQELLTQIQGEQMQLPPAFSAIKKNGVTAYKAAREGKEIELEPRKVFIQKAQLIDTGFEEVNLDDGNGGMFTATLPYWDVELCVSKGTYIRSIARDLGQRLGCGAHLSALRRIKSGELDIACTHTLEELAALKEQGELFPWADPVQALAYPHVELSEEQLKHVQNGRELRVGALPKAADAAQALVSCVYQGKLMAVYEAAGDTLKPQAVIPGGVCGAHSASAGDKDDSSAVADAASGSDAAAAATAASDSAAIPASWTWGEPWPLDAPYECVAAMGVFDGLHKGHRQLIADAYAEAARREVPLALVSFERDPDEFFLMQDEQEAVFKLQTNAQRLSGMEAYLRALQQQCVRCSSASGKGSNAVEARLFAIPTSRQTLAQEPDEFLSYMQSVMSVRAFYVGEGFRFGARAAGTTQTLADWCAAQGAELHVHALVLDADEPVSSTRIRALLKEEGDAQECCRLRCGVMHSICGLVVHGRGEGADMGFATANLDLKDAAQGVVLPAEGVYAGFACVCDEHGAPAHDGGEPGFMLPAAINVGVAKSFENATAELEVHVIGLQGDIYGKLLRVWFAKRLRGQRKFTNQDELIATVTHDINWVKNELEPLPAGKAIDSEGLAEY